MSTSLAVPKTSAAPARSRSRLAPRARKNLLIVHIVASVALLGACASTLVTGLTAAMTDDAELARSAYELLDGGTQMLGIPFSVIALVSGVVLSLRGKWGFSYRWIDIKLVALIAVVLLGAIGQGTFLAQLAESPNPGDEAARWFVPATAGLQIALLTLSTVLSVNKPSARIKRPRLLPRR